MSGETAFVRAAPPSAPVSPRPVTLAVTPDDPAEPTAEPDSEVPAITEPAPEPVDLDFPPEPQFVPGSRDRPAPAAPVRSGKPPGPGLPEVLLWCAGWFVAVQLLIMVPLYLAVRGAGGALLGRALTEPETLIVALPAAQILGAIYTLAAFRLRVGRLTKLGLRLPPAGVSAVAFLSLPAVMFACGQWGAVAGWLWAAARRAAPGLEALDGVSSLTMVNELLRTVPMPALLLAVAVCPAVGEELFCRGLIGRGLIARWGVGVGVALTSLLFCAQHLHPAHALALIPAAVWMHLSYLASRSLWLPVGLHFANNAVSILLAKWALSLDQLPDPHAAQPVSIPGFLFGTGMTVVACWAIWSLRSRPVDVAGREVAPRWPTVERPSERSGLGLVTKWEPWPLGLWGLCVAPLGPIAAVSLLALALGWVEG